MEQLRLYHDQLEELPDGMKLSELRRLVMAAALSAARTYDYALYGDNFCRICTARDKAQRHTQQREEELAKFAGLIADNDGEDDSDYGQLPKGRAHVNTDSAKKGDSKASTKGATKRGRKAGAGKRAATDEPTSTSTTKKSAAARTAEQTDTKFNLLMALMAKVVPKTDVLQVAKNHPGGAAILAMLEDDDVDPDSMTATPTSDAGPGPAATPVLMLAAGEIAKLVRIVMRVSRVSADVLQAIKAVATYRGVEKDKASSNLTNLVAAARSKLHKLIMGTPEAHLSEAVVDELDGALNDNNVVLPPGLSTSTMKHMSRDEASKVWAVTTTGTGGVAPLCHPLHHVLAMGYKTLKAADDRQPRAGAIRVDHVECWARLECVTPPTPELLLPVPINVLSQTVKGLTMAHVQTMCGILRKARGLQ